MNNFTGNAIDVRNLGISFNSNRIVDDFSFSVGKRQKAVLAGASGKGKTSVLNALMGFIHPDKGEISIFGTPVNSGTIKKIRSNMFWMPQEINYDTGVEEFIRLPFSYAHNKPVRFNRDELVSLLTDLHLSDEILNKRMTEISGGEKQRIGIIVAIILKKPLLLLDEPVSALDEIIKQKVIDVILSLKDTTILATSHDLYLKEKSDVIIYL